MALPLAPAEEVDPARCPACGEPNQCGAVAGAERCWCFDAVIPGSLLASLPPKAQGKACVCPRCAAAVPVASKEP